MSFFAYWPWATQVAENVRPIAFLKWTSEEVETKKELLKIEKTAQFGAFHQDAQEMIFNFEVFISF